MKNQSYEMSELVFHFMTAEWLIALLYILSMWLFTSQTRYALLGFPLFAAALASGVYVSWMMAHAGLTAQLVILSVVSLYGVLRGRSGLTLRRTTIAK
jgi:4-amino-4-deoxy-L-arabinose transferase-like glycosyltransferase